MTVICLPRDGRAVLDNVAAGRSPWHGWDAGQVARSPEGQAAYLARARAITACRELDLLTPENLLTPAAQALLQALEAFRG